MTGRHSARATRALQRLAETDPALASLSLWIDHEDSDDRSLPAWSGPGRICYGPAFATLSLAEQTGLCAHHILHVAFRHAARGAAMQLRFGADHDADLFNIASDAVLNEAVFLAGYVLPRPCVQLTGLIAEAFGPAPDPGDALAAWDTEKLYVRLMSAEAGRGNRSAADAARAYAADRGFARDLDPASGDGAPEEEEEEEDAGEWRQRIAKAMEAGRLAGRGLGTIGHRLADLPDIRTPWEVILRGLLTKAVTETPRRSWTRPTGRWLALDSTGRRAPFEPGKAGRARAPRIAVGIDSSGSIDAPRLALFAAQVSGIARRTGAETHVLVFDDGVRERRVIKAGAWESAITTLAFSRDGGTDFTEVLREADALDPAVIVMLTDLDAAPPTRPRAPVIWAVPDQAAAEPPFGRVISLAR